ncbi:MAG: hypothetical protein IKK24_02305, partial [Clostridia bacterium]|nr:hypothetical protein [Clostridia bacterium]
MRTKRKKSVLWRLLLIGVSVYMVVTLAGLWSTFSESKAQLKELEMQKELKETEIEELKALLDTGSKEELIERA